MVAETVELPTASAVTSPLVPGMLLTEATPVTLELQVTALVRSCVELSAKVPMAVNWRLVPLESEGLVGVTTSEVSVLAASAEDPETVPSVAWMMVVPLALLETVASPCDPEALLTEAMVGVSELQVTRSVRSWVVPSGKLPMAVNCWVEPATALGLVGVTVMRLGPRTVTVEVAGVTA
jgi:hypothetical protein